MPIEKRTCKLCGKVFDKNAGNRKKYCSSCRMVIRAARQLKVYYKKDRKVRMSKTNKPRACVYCGKLYKPNVGNQKSCQSKECWHEYYKDRYQRQLNDPKRHNIKKKAHLKYYYKNKANPIFMDKKRRSVNESNKKHRERLTINTQKYRAKKRELPHTFTKEQWSNAKTYFKNKCAFCGGVWYNKKGKIEYHQEHFVALSRNGEYTKNNIIPACGACNSSKLNHDFFEWYPKQPFYSIFREKKILNYLGYKADKTQQISLAV